MMRKEENSESQAELILCSWYSMMFFSLQAKINLAFIKISSKVQISKL